MTPPRHARASLRSAEVAAVVGVLLALFAPSTAAADELPPAVAIDARGINDQDFAQLGIVSLTSRLALRLTQAGYAVIALEHRPLIAIFLRVPKKKASPAAPREVRVIVASASATRRRRVQRTSGNLAAFHLQVMNAAIEAVREVEAAIRQAMATRPVAPGPAPEEPPPLRPRRAANAAARWKVSKSEVGLAVLAHYRPGGTDLAFRIGGRHQIFWPQLGARWSLRYSPSHAEAGGGKLDIAEWGLELGLDWRHRFSPRLSVDFGLVGGFQAHRYAFSQGDFEPISATRWDATAVAFAELGWRFSPTVTIVLWGAGGIASREREHHLSAAPSPDADTLLWRRGRTRLEGGGGFRVQL